MRITQFVDTADGGSEFQEIEIAQEIARPGADGYTLMSSSPFTSAEVSLIELPAELDQAWHQAPARQFVVVLSGALEVTTTDGDSRRFQRGEFFIAADIHGKGHKTRTLDGAANVLFVPLADDAWR